MKKLLTLLVVAFVVTTSSVNVSAKTNYVPIKLGTLISTEKETFFYQAPNGEVDSIDFSGYSTIYVIKVTQLIANPRGDRAIISSGRVISGEGYLMSSSYFTPAYRNVLNFAIPSSGGYIYLQMLSKVGKQIQLELVVNGYKQKFIIKISKQ